MKTISGEALRALVAQIFRQRGVPDEDSEIVADCLVHANLRGVDSHGVMRVAHYVRRLAAGSVVADAVPARTRTAAAAAVVDGGDGLGHVAVWHAMRAAIEIARESGVGFVGVVRSSHCGPLSFYACQAMEAGMVGMAFTQTDSAVVPTGGRRGFCGTNPLCIGAPTAEGPPILLDMATSTVAGGHVFKARAEGRAIPPNWAVDADGEPTTDPDAARYFTPAGGPKGYGLGVMVDVLTGLLCGGVFGPHVPPMYSELDRKRGLCHLVAAIDPVRFGGERLPQEAARLVDELHAEPTAPGVERVLAPGEPEYRRAQERQVHGIPLEDYLYDELQSLAQA